MADITGIFKSTVKMLKVRHKDLSAIKKGSSGQGDEQQSAGGKDLLFKSKKASNGMEGGENFSAKTKQIVENITNLRTFLIKNRKAYMAASSNIPIDGVVKLTESERDNIDADAMKYMKLCNETLSKFKSKSLHKKLSMTHREHRTFVIQMVEDYLKVVCQLYAEQRAIRVRRAVERQSMSRLDMKSSRKSTDQEPSTSNKGNQNQDKTSGAKSSQKQATQVFDEFEPAPTAVPEISKEEAQMFAQENEQLYSDMNSTLDEVRQIEGKVVEISRLQEIFTDKVLEQEADIDRIGDAMVESTENVVTGNEDIREAMKNNAGMRVWIIFGICVLAFTLLFLDWYYD